MSGDRDPVEPATVVGRRSSGRPSNSGAPARSEVRSAPRAASAERDNSSASDAALADILLAEEAMRAHGFAGATVPTSLIVAPIVSLLGGEPTARLLCTCALLACATVSAWVYWLTRPALNGRRYTRVVHRVYGGVLLAAMVFVEYYAGVFSPVPVVLSFGIYYFGQSLGRTDSLVMPFLAIASYVLLAILTTFGAIADRGLFAAPEAAFSSRIFAVGAAISVLTMTLRMARVSRAALREAIERSNEALLLAQRREAQLVEARNQLAHALRVTVGKPGRYTGSLAGEYRLENVIGVGAIGEVYAAAHAQSGARAAVKLLQASALVREDLIGRIMREGAITTKLDNPHIVRVFEVGRMEDGAPYLAMELLEGRDLAARLRQDGQLPLDELMRLASALGAGLQHANDAGVVHRDLKPLNIFEAVEGRNLCWKILDFGISKLTSSTGTLTQEGVVGTPGYMSPEQARGAVVDHRSDVFSMAVVLFRALTGQPAFPGDNTPQILFDVVYKVARRPSHAAKHIPADLDLVLAVAMAKEPTQRFQSAAEFARAFVLACKRQLPEDLRERGAAAVRAYPWGATLSQRGES